MHTAGGEHDDDHRRRRPRLPDGDHRRGWGARGDDAQWILFSLLILI